jgi:extracellular elastinolytic metalloproteinase
MKVSRQRCASFGRAALLLASALAVGCAGDPPAFDSSTSDDDGRVELGTTSVAARNFDARENHNKGRRLADAKVTPVLLGRFADADIDVQFDESTGVTRSLMSRIGFLTAAQPGGPDAVASNFLRTSIDTLGLTAADVAGMELTDRVFSRITGTTHLYYRQRHLGLPVYNGQLQFHIQKDGSILSINNAFVPNIAALAQSAVPTLGADQAVAAAADNLSVSLGSDPVASVAPLAGVERRTLIDAPDLSRGTIDAKLMWVPVNAKQVALVWNFQVETLDGNHHFDYAVDADTGKVWTRFDWTNSDSYRAYREPVESANHSSPPQPADGRVLIANPHNTTASPLAWHNDGTTAFTIHRGNNVHAYDDRDANNQPPASQPACAPGLVCDFPLNLAGQPSTYTPAAVSNLFYWNNLIHDVLYQYGFDEVGGNFQVNNFGNGGLGNDPVRAEAQDASGTNNANFATPVDGSPPRMQMFEWTQTTPRRDGDLDNGIIVHEYGHGISIRQVGGPNNSSCLNNAQQGGEGWSDWFALWFTHEAGDTGPDPRGIGTYALGQPTSGPGIRTQRYSTNQAVNTWTYQSISGMAIPHGVGSVWAQAIWEVYWALVDEHGFDPNRHNATGNAGNQRALLYINEGLKNTACSPTFVDARNGIIAAATAAHGGEDVCLLWEAFAAYGLGTNAVSGGSNSTNPTNGFNIPAECACSPNPTANAGPDRTICAGDSTTLGTAALPGHTYSWTPGGATTAQITVSPAATTVFTVTASTSCGSASDSATVTVDAGGGGGFSDDFETGATGWTATGLWHLASNSACASPQPGFSSPTRAFYYGRDQTCNYNTGATNTGDLTSPAISGITSTSALSFDFYRQVESFNGQFDRTTVDVIRSNGTATTVFTRDSRNPSTPLAWQSSGNISLAAFAGDTIRLRFRFNTVDGSFNNFDGWFIDDVSVTTSSSCVQLDP